MSLDKRISIIDADFCVDFDTKNIKLKDSVTASTISRLLNEISKLERTRDGWPSVSETIWTIETVNNKELNSTKA